MPCSTGDKLFALCDPASHGCLSKHKADLTDPKHKMRVSVGRYGKRKVSADRGGAPAPTRRQGRLVRAAAEVARGRGPLAHGILGPVAILVPPRVTAAKGGGYG